MSCIRMYLIYESTHFEVTETSLRIKAKKLQQPLVTAQITLVNYRNP